MIRILAWVIFLYWGNPLMAQISAPVVGGVCHAEQEDYFWAGNWELQHNELVCNYWQYIDFDTLPVADYGDKSEPVYDDFDGEEFISEDLILDIRQSDSESNEDNEEE